MINLIFGQIPNSLLAFIIFLHLAVIGLVVFVIFLAMKLRTTNKENIDSHKFKSDYKSLVDNYPGMAYRCLYDEFWTMKFVSPKAFELLGYSESDLIDNFVISFEEIIHPKYRFELRKQWDIVLLNKEDFVGDYQIITKSGELKWVHEIGRGVFNKAGEVLYVEGYIFDITEEKQLVVAQRKSEARYRSLIENAPDPIYIDSNGEIIYANPACFRFFRCDPLETLIGKHIEDLITEEYIQFYRDRVDRLAQTHMPNPMAEYAFKRCDGTIAYAEVSSSADYDSNSMTILVFIHDLSEIKRSSEQFRRIQNRNRDLIVQMTEGIGVFSKSKGDESAAYILIFANRSFSKILFGSVKRIIGISLQTLFGNIIDPMEDAISEAIDSKRTHLAEISYHGNQILELRFTGNEDHELVLMIRDVSNIKNFEASLTMERNRLSTIIKGTNTATWEWNLKTHTIMVNSRWAEIIGYTYEELEPYTPNTFYAHLYPGDSEVTDRELQKHLNGETDYYQSEFRMVHKDGHPVWILDRGCITQYDESGKPLMICGTHQDITERKEKELEVYKLSYYDYLTGLCNRRKFDEKKAIFNTESALPLTLLMADVDALKITNDAFGHHNGDKLLSHVADRLRDISLDKTNVFRIGGDEFVILLPNCTSDEAEKMAEKLKKEFESDIVNGLPISVSFGIATRYSMDESFDDIFNNPEMMMYSKKIVHSGNFRMDVIDVVKQNFFDTSPQEKIHSDLVRVYMRSLGEKLALDPTDVSYMEVLAEVHDIGKISIEPSLLIKIEPLELTDLIRIRQHPETGYRILYSSDKYDKVAIDVLYHHERWDGSGYPKKLDSDKIPFKARCLAICEAYAAMIQDYSYRKAIGKIEAAKEIVRNSGTQFDPKIALVFVTQVLNLPFEV